MAHRSLPFTAAALALALVLSALAGCSGTKEGRLRFIFIAPNVNEEFFRPVKKGMADAGALLGVDCTFTGTEGVDAATQARLVRKAILEGYDGIAVDMIDPEAFDEVARMAADQNLPLVAFNIDDASSPNARLAAVCQRFPEAGRALGIRAAAKLPSGSRVLFTKHDEGITALDERVAGAREALKVKGIDGKVLVTGPELEKAEKTIEAALREDPALAAVISSGQTDTQAAGLVVERLRRESGRSNLFAAGFDLSPEILRLVRSGPILVTIDQQPYVQGFYPVVQLYLRSRYGIYPSSMDAGANPITKENAAAVAEMSRRGYR
jgi:simple sugar transport system substrate-binding protein